MKWWICAHHQTPEIRYLPTLPANRHCSSRAEKLTNAAEDIFSCLAFSCLNAPDFVIRSYIKSLRRLRRAGEVDLITTGDRAVSPVLRLTFQKSLPGGLIAKLCPTHTTPWTIACQAPVFMGFSRQEYWSGLPFLSLDRGMEPRSPVLQADSLQTELWRKPLNSINLL